MKLPLKTRILQYAIEKNAPFTLEDVMRDLAGEYPNERIFNEKQIAEYLESFIGVSFLRAVEMSFDDKGEVAFVYQITDYGKSREKYMH